MSKILRPENQRMAWNIAGYDGDPALEVTMLDVYEWEEEVMECLTEVRDSLQAVFENDEREELELELVELEGKKEKLYEVLEEEGYTHGLYYEDDNYPMEA